MATPADLNACIMQIDRSLATARARLHWVQGLSAAVTSTDEERGQWRKDVRNIEGDIHALNEQKCKLERRLRSAALDVILEESGKED
ncbi:hypothetical protein LCGC14_0983460 [marine sediment metagenome]|uniref:Uncharacterized protein n=1 Tax=marine sediment metagenome TaxID=412755 RepID=A0A0F9NUC3_9ZZZZ